MAGVRLRRPERRLGANMCRSRSVLYSSAALFGPLIASPPCRYLSHLPFGYTTPICYTAIM
jgi:hypothetical protein